MLEQSSIVKVTRHLIVDFIEPAMLGDYFSIITLHYECGVLFSVALRCLWREIAYTLVFFHLKDQGRLYPVETTCKIVNQSLFIWLFIIHLNICVRDRNTYCWRVAGATAYYGMHISIIKWRIILLLVIIKIVFYFFH